MKQISHKRTDIVCFHLHEVPRTGNFTKTENRIEVTRNWGTERMRSCCLMRTEFQFGEVKCSGGGWLIWVHNNLKVLNISVPNCILKNG